MRQEEQEAREVIETPASRSIADDLAAVFGNEVGFWVSAGVLAGVLVLFAILAARVLLPIIFVLAPASIAMLADTAVRLLRLIGKPLGWIFGQAEASAAPARGKANRTNAKPAHSSRSDKFRHSWRVYYGVMGWAWTRFVIRDLVKFGVGWRDSWWTPVLIVLMLIWAGYGVYIQAPGILETISNDTASAGSLLEVLHAAMEGTVRYIATLTPTVMIFTSPDNFEPPIRLAHYLGSLIFLWGALPPLLALLIRTLEGWITANLASNHYVVIGLGMAGSALATSLLEEKSNLVIAVEADSTEEALRELHKKGCITLKRDATRIGLKSELSLHRAKGVFIALGDDSLNLDIAGRIASQVTEMLRKDGRATRSEHPMIIPHINDLALRQRLSRNEGLFIKPPDQDEFTILPRPFSSDEMSVRLLLHGQLRSEEDCNARCSRETLTGYARLLGAPGVHAVILGFDNAAETLVTELLQFALAPGLEPPRITIVIDDPASESSSRRTARVADTEEAFYRRFPALKEAKFDARIKFVGADLTTIQEGLLDRVEGETAKPQRDALVSWLNGDPATKPDLDAIAPNDAVTAIFVCLENDGQTLSAGLALQSLSDKTNRWQAPIFLRLRRDAGLKNILRDPDRTREISKVIYDFGQDHLVCSADNVFNRPDEPAARAAHGIYQVTDAAFKVAAARKTLARPEAAKDTPSTVAALKKAEEALTKAEENLTRAIAAEDALKDQKDKSAASKTGSDGERADDTVASNAARANRIWEELTKDFVVSNISQALHARTKLDALGFRAFEMPAKSGLEPGIRSGGFASYGQVKDVLGVLGSTATSEREQVTQRSPFLPLAYVEHERFIAERTVLGWVYGEERDNQRRIHNLMRDFETLDADDQFRDISTAVFLPNIASKLRPETIWKPELRIGLIGYGLVESLSYDPKKAINSALEKLLAEFAEAHADWLSPAGKEPDRPPEMILPVLISTLAPGADFLLARTAADHFFQQAAPQCSQKVTAPRLLVPRPFGYGDDPDSANPDRGLKDDASCDGLPSDWFDIQTNADDNLLASKATSYRLERTGLLQCFGDEKHTASDEWMVDLMPPGTGYQHCRIGQRSSARLSDEVRKRREEFRSSQVERATRYIRQRADWTLVLEASVIGQTQDDQIRNNAAKADLPPLRNIENRLPDVRRPELKGGFHVEGQPGVKIAHCGDRRMTFISLQP